LARLDEPLSEAANGIGLFVLVVLGLNLLLLLLHRRPRVVTFGQARPNLCHFYQCGREFL